MVRDGSDDRLCVGRAERREPYVEHVGFPPKSGQSVRQRLVNGYVLGPKGDQ
jgi:hypothetical protein